MGKRGPAVKYVVRPDADERQQLEGIIRTGCGAASRLPKARIFLQADVSTEGQGWDDAQTTDPLETSFSAVYRTRRRLVQEGLGAALARRTSPKLQSWIFDGEKGAPLTTLACSKPPEGYARWLLRPLEKRRVELGIVEQASDTLATVSEPCRKFPKTHEKKPSIH